MMSNDRISRKQRLKALGNRKAGIAVGLSLILLLLIIGKAYRTELRSLMNETLPDGLLREGIRENTDSLILQAGFGLNYPARVDTVFRNLSGDRRIRIIQPWPERLPLVTYAERLKEISERLEMACSCVAYGDDDSLCCRLMGENSSQIEIAVLPDRKTKLLGKSVGIILKNLYDLNNQDINEIIESRIPFGYLATADVFPAGDIKKQLQSKWVASILNIPASRNRLAQYISLRSKDKSGHKQSRETDYNALASDLFDRHPNPASFGLERSDDIDYMFVEAVMRQALKKGASYIYDGKDAPDKIDSLAYSSGLTIVTYDRIIDYTRNGLNEIRLSLFNNLLRENRPQSILIAVDISRMKIGNWIELTRFLDDIGINTLNINKLTDYPEFILGDL